MKKIIIGILVGATAGIIDLIPMFVQKLPWDANLSAFSMWVVVGFLLSITELKTNSLLKGIIIPLAVLLPNTFIIGWKEPLTLIPIVIITIILGIACSYTIDKL
jgi:hypothetical protein